MNLDARVRRLEEGMAKPLTTGELQRLRAAHGSRLAWLAKQK